MSIRSLTYTLFSFVLYALLSNNNQIITASPLLGLPLPSPSSPSDGSSGDLNLNVPVLGISADIGPSGVALAASPLDLLTVSVEVDPTHVAVAAALPASITAAVNLNSNGADIKVDSPVASVEVDVGKGGVDAGVSVAGVAAVSASIGSQGVDAGAGVLGVATAGASVGSQGVGLDAGVTDVASVGATVGSQGVGVDAVVTGVASVGATVGSQGVGVDAVVTGVASVGATVGSQGIGLGAGVTGVASVGATIGSQGIGLGAGVTGVASVGATIGTQGVGVGVGVTGVASVTASIGDQGVDVGVGVTGVGTASASLGSQGVSVGVTIGNGDTTVPAASPTPPPALPTIAPSPTEAPSSIPGQDTPSPESPSITGTASLPDLSAISIIEPDDAAPKNTLPFLSEPGGHAFANGNSAAGVEFVPTFSSGALTLLPSSGSTSTGTPGSNPNGGGGSNKHGISPTTIGLIVAALLLAPLAVIFCLRLCGRRRRREKTQVFWTAKSKSKSIRDSVWVTAERTGEKPKEGERERKGYGAMDSTTPDRPVIRTATSPEPVSGRWMNFLPKVFTSTSTSANPDPNDPASPSALSVLSTSPDLDGYSDEKHTYSSQPHSPTSPTPFVNNAASSSRASGSRQAIDWPIYVQRLSTPTSSGPSPLPTARIPSPRRPFSPPDDLISFAESVSESDESGEYHAHAYSEQPHVEVRNGGSSEGEYYQPSVWDQRSVLVVSDPSLPDGGAHAGSTRSSVVSEGNGSSEEGSTDTSHTYTGTLYSIRRPDSIYGGYGSDSLPASPAYNASFSEAGPSTQQQPRPKRDKRFVYPKIISTCSCSSCDTNILYLPPSESGHGHSCSSHHGHQGGAGAAGPSSGHSAGVTWKWPS